MKRFLTCIASGVVAIGLIGCGDSAVDEGTVPFKATNTNTPGFEEMKKQMMGNVKGPTPKKSAEKADSSAPKAEEKPAETPK